MSQARNALKLGGGSLVLDDATLIAIGGNLPSDAGDPVQTITTALQQFEGFDLHLRAISAFYRTPCFPPGSGPDYVNAAVAISTSLSATAILDASHAIEAHFGRKRLQRWGRRTLDLDLVAVGNSVMPDSGTQNAWRGLPLEEQMKNTPNELVLPHPRLQDRGFVLVPLADIAADWVHPLLNQSVGKMLRALPPHAREEVKKL